MQHNIIHLKRSLRRIGLSDSIIEAAWPDWWSEDAAASGAAQSELRFSLARKLGLDPRSLFDEQMDPRFVWVDGSRFKNLSAATVREKAAITSFGISFARLLFSSFPARKFDENLSALEIRKAILASHRYVGLKEIVGLCWALGIPVVHLRVFPLPAKRMHAMSVEVGGRYAILLGKDSVFPAQIAFYLAHELGHILLGHLHDNQVIVDLESETGERLDKDDDEEKTADQFALTLLTGEPELQLKANTNNFTSRQLAEVSYTASSNLGIEPGTFAMCYGYASEDWPKAMAALRHIYRVPQDVWMFVNKVAEKELDLSEMQHDSGRFLAAVLGLSS